MHRSWLAYRIAAEMRKLDGFTGFHLSVFHLNASHSLHLKIGTLHLPPPLPILSSIPSLLLPLHISSFPHIPIPSNIQWSSG